MDGDEFEATIISLAAEVTERGARGIASAITRMAGAGTLSPGQRLPTVRRIAHDLGVSPTTVNEAWQLLGYEGTIESRGRLGTFVLPMSRLAGPRRYRRVTQRADSFRIDLSTGTPDPALLPDLRGALSRIGRGDLTSSYLDRPVLPELEQRIRQLLPFEPEALTVVDGALDALDRIATQVVRRGDRVLVENPTFPPLLDLLQQIGAELVPLEVDQSGIVPDALASALQVRPVAIFLQPRAHNPTGASMSTMRSSALAKLLRPHQLVIVEDDHSGAISSAADVSLARLLPSQTLHITSFSKSHGPDLRLAAVAGPANLIDVLSDRRTLGPGWSSRILQAVLADLLADRLAVGEVAAARDEYARRRRRMSAALDKVGVVYTPGDGINMWLETPHEQETLVSLAAAGIGASPGSPFIVAPSGRDHIRVTVGLIAGDYDNLAEQFAKAIPEADDNLGRRRGR
jgi:DNA-binding transcriptional MocR family regulator